MTRGKIGLNYQWFFFISWQYGYVCMYVFMWLVILFQSYIDPNIKIKMKWIFWKFEIIYIMWYDRFDVHLLFSRISTYEKPLWWIRIGNIVSFKILKLLPCAASIAIESCVFQSSARGFHFLPKTIENLQY
jgi:hypothetical protein